MKKYTYISIVIFAAGSFIFAQESEQVNTCISCHDEMDPPYSTPVNQIAGSVHARAGLSCTGCHGGDPTSDDPDISMSPAKGFEGKPSGAASVKICAKCHSDPTYMRNYNPNISVDQDDRYRTSQHGILLSKGDQRVAICTSCHGVHDIKPADDPTSAVYPLNIADKCGECHANTEYMESYGIPTDQLTEYKSSVHGKMLNDKGDLSAPTCNDCHGNHGAVPPGITSIANICGTCHDIQSDYFASSPHKMAFDDMGISECEVCHGNHTIQPATDKMIGTEEPSTCIECHDGDSEGYRIAGLLRSEIDSLSMNINTANQMLTRAQQTGVLVPPEDLLHIADAKAALIQIQTLVHTFSFERIKENSQKGLESSEKALQAGMLALDEVNHRRQMLIVMVFLTLLVAVLLILYIRHRQKTVKAS